MANRPTTSLALRIALLVEGFFHKLTALFKKPLDADQPLNIIAYYGFGNSTRAQLSGRILLKKERTVRTTTGRRANLRNNFAHFNTDEIGGIHISGQFGGCNAAAVSDDEGYFTLTFNSSCTANGPNQFTTASSGVLSHYIELTLPDFPNVHIEGDPTIMLPARSACFGIISDVDDTLMVTRATSVFQILKLTLLESAESRVAFSGVAEFYAALHNQTNPFFYVSSSPWNLYSFLTEFMHQRGIVPGPIMLRDFGLDETKFIAGSHTDHKLVHIRRVLDCYPDLSFILFGDSGQDDPQIYTQIAQEYPSRIKAIYIRDVGRETSRSKIQALADHLAMQQIDMLLVANTLEAAVHSADRGFISVDALSKLRHIENTNK